MHWIRHIVGLLTIVAGVLGGSYLWSLANKTHTDDELSFTLLFENAEGLREGARLAYRGVTVGEVRQIRLDATGNAVQIECAVNARGANSVRATSRFWIVRPQFLGLTEGATGLDTLIKDPYLSFDSPDESAPPLPSGSTVPGRAHAPGGWRDSRIGPPGRGDLRFTVVFAENSRLEPGARVRFRGMDVGVIERVKLSPRGDAVWVTARIQRDHRDTVRESSVFWIARPMAEASWTSGFEVHDIDALLGGAYLSYYTPEGSGQQASDDYRFRGSNERPDLDWDAPSLELQPELSPDRPSADPLAESLVRVFYDFRERDFWSPDDLFQLEGLGVCFTTRDGFTAVLTHRRRVDGAFLVSESLGEPDIDDEVLKVRLASGAIHKSGRVWVEPEGLDMALLRVDKVDRGLARELEAPLVFGAVPATDIAVEVIALADNGQLSRQSGVVQSNGSLSGPAAKLELGVVLSNGQVIGLSSLRDGHASFIGFDRLPASLRPAGR